MIIKLLSIHITTYFIAYVLHLGNKDNFRNLKHCSRWDLKLSCSYLTVLESSQNSSDTTAAITNTPQSSSPRCFCMLAISNFMV